MITTAGTIATLRGGFTMYRVQCLCFFCTLLAVTGHVDAQVKPVGSEVGELPAVDRESIAKRKKGALKAAEGQDVVIQKVILDSPKLDPEKKTQLVAIQKASLGLQSVILATQATAAENRVKFKNSADPQAKANLIEGMNHAGILNKKKQELHESLVPYLPPGIDVTPDGTKFPDLARPIPKLNLPDLDQLPTYQKAQSILETLTQLKQADIEADTAPGRSLTSRTEQLLQQLNTQYDAATPGDNAFQLRSLRDQERLKVQEVNRHEATVITHNNQYRDPPTRPTIPETVYTEADRMYWQGVVEDYNGKLKTYDEWAGPYNTEAAELNATTARLESELNAIRAEIEPLLDQR